MANRLPSIFQQFLTADPNVREGSLLYSYAAGTSTPLATYTDKDLTVGLENTNPIVLDSLGQPPNAVFLSNVGYKFILKTSAGVTVWTADDVFTSDYSSRAKITGYSGNPNTHVAGTAATGSTAADVIMDYANNIIYVCTTTGTALTAVWTAINSSTAANVVPMPQGYLTLTSATPVIAADVASATTVYYALDQGNLVPVYSGSAFVPSVFTELSLSLVASHAANTLYDVFVFSNSGVLTLVTGPAWTTSTAGSGARGAGASTTELTRVSGIYVNAAQITGRNGSTTYTIAANKATYLGSIYIDGTAGQVTCHRAAGQNRKWGVWNAYNRRVINLKCADPTASWNYNTAAIRASNNVPSSYASASFNFGSGTTSNGINILTGLAEEAVEGRFTQRVSTGVSAALGSSSIGFGVNSTTAFSGTLALFVGNSTNFQESSVASNIVAPSLGLNIVACLETINTAGGAANQAFFGTEGNMVMTATYRG